MKKLILFFFVFLHTNNLMSQQFSYWAETPEVDSFIVIENNKKIFASCERIENTQFQFKFENPQKTFIRIYCKDCGDKISITLYSKKDYTYFKNITLDNGQKISISECLKRSTHESFISLIWSSVKELWPSSLSSRKPPRAGSPKGHDQENNDSTLVFLDNSNFYFLEVTSFRVRAIIKNDVPIESITISSEESRILAAGDPKSEKKFRKIQHRIEEVIDQTPINEKERQIEIHWDKIHARLHQEFEKGKWYELKIKLEGSRFPYLFKFRFLTDRELEAIENFFTRD
ncbi:MAG: hypothetical protein ACKV1O_21990 [Saprospiraceae bacterium]